MGSDSNAAFVIDKHGQTIFFPWRRRGKGYIVPDLETRRKLNILALGFIWGVFLFPFLILFLSILVVFLRWNYYLCIDIFVGVPVNLFVLYFVIVDAVTKNLTVYSMSYRELILDNLSSDDQDDYKA